MMSRFLEKFARAGVFGLWSVACIVIMGIISAVFGEAIGFLFAVFLIAATLYYIMDV